MSIYDDIRGSSAGAATVDDFYERVLADPNLGPYFEGVDVKRLRGHQRGFIAAAIGGPQLYAGRSMRDAHARFNIKPEHFDLVVGHLVDSLVFMRVPEPIIG